MYEVSEKYKSAMKEQVQSFMMIGTIGSVIFKDNNILKGSFSITNQCSGNEIVEIGQVYIGELNATFLDLDLLRYTWKGKEIRPAFAQVFDDGTYEFIPLGAFTVDEAEWTQSGVVVKAYDNMAKFDKTCSTLLENAKPYDILSIACEECGVGFGMVEDDFKGITNGEQDLSEFPENDVETWRDVISWVAQTCASFATMDRMGKLVLRQYGQEAVDTITDTERFSGASFSDYVTRYTGITSVYNEEQKTEYDHIDLDDGLVYNLGNNPFLQHGVLETRSEMRHNILEGMSGISYVPFKVRMIGNPVYDLGDVLVFKNGIADGTKKYCITKFVFNYNGDYEVQGVGQNPVIASAKSKTDKNLSGLISSGGGGGGSSMVYYVLHNAAKVTVSDGKKKSLLDARFIVRSDSHVRINMEVLLTITPTESGGTSVGTVYYYYDGTEITDRHPVETWAEGKHILTLQYDIVSATAQMHTFDLKLEMSGGKAVIDKMGVYEIIYGDGLVAEGEKWDGTLDITDHVDFITFENMIKHFEDTVDIKFEETKKPILQDAVHFISFNNLIKGFTDNVVASEKVMVFSPWTNANLVTTSCTVDNSKGWVGSGTESSGDALMVTFPELAKVDHVDVAASSAIFYASPDAGVNWYGYTPSGWQQGVSMTIARLKQITKEGWDAGDTWIIRAILEKGTSLYSIDIYGADTNINDMNRYVMNAEKGNKTFNKKFVTVEDGKYVLRMVHTVESEPGEIDSGEMAVLTIDKSVYKDITDITVTSEVVY